MRIYGHVRTMQGPGIPESKVPDSKVFRSGMVSSIPDQNYNRILIIFAASLQARSEMDCILFW